MIPTTIRVNDARAMFDVSDIISITDKKPVIRFVGLQEQSSAINSLVCKSCIAIYIVLPEILTIALHCDCLTWLWGKTQGHSRRRIRHFCHPSLESRRVSRGDF
jgi:hypothetical protein